MSAVVDKSPYEGKESYAPPTVKELESIRNDLGKCVAKAMQEITTIRTHHNSNWEQSIKLLDYGFWRGQDLAEALLKLNTPASQQRYDVLRDKGWFVEGRLPAPYFEPIFIPQDGLKREFQWLLAPGQNLPEALNEMRKGFPKSKIGCAIIDCGAAVTIARMIGLMDYLQSANGDVGVQKLKRLFTAPHGQQMYIGYKDDAFNPLRYFICFTEAARKQKPGVFGNRPVKVGQAININGVKEYNQKHPFSQSSNFNLICVDDIPGAQRFAGNDVPGGGVSEIEVDRLMATDFNEKPNYYIRIPKHRIFNANIILAQRDSVKLQDYKVKLKYPERVVEGYDRGSPQDFEPRLIYDVVKAPLEAISLDFIKSKPYVSRDY